MIGFKGLTKQRETEFINFCIENDNVIYVNKTIGSWDIELDVITENNQEFHVHK